MDCEQLLNAIYNDMQTLKTDITNINTYIANMSNLNTTVDNIYTHVYALRMEELPAFVSSTNAKFTTTLEGITSISLQCVANGSGIGAVYNELAGAENYSIGDSLDEIKAFLGLGFNNMAGLLSTALRARYGVKSFDEAKRLKNVAWSEFDDFAAGYDYLREVRQTTKNDVLTEIQNVETVSKESLPTNSQNVTVTVTNPTNLQHYLTQQNEMIGVLTETFQNLVAQATKKNELIIEQTSAIKAQSIYSEALVETLHDVISPIGVQLQELTKIPSIMTLNSDIKVAYDELGLEHNESIRDYFQGLNDRLSLMESSMEWIANSANLQSLTLGGISTSLGDVASNARSQKVIADYEQTEQDIKNLDGNVVATARPMEIKTQSEAVKAKNETDEMEFELDDEIIDNVFSGSELPTFTKATLDDDIAFALNKINSMGV